MKRREFRRFYKRFVEVEKIPGWGAKMDAKLELLEESTEMYVKAMYKFRAKQARRHW